MVKTVIIEIDQREAGVGGIPELSPVALTEARRAVAMTREELAQATKGRVSVSTVYQHENKKYWARLQERTNAALVEALRDRGVKFVVARSRQSGGEARHLTPAE